MGSALLAPINHSPGDAGLVDILPAVDTRPLVYDPTPSAAVVCDPDFHDHANAGILDISGKRRHRLSPASSTPGFLLHLRRGGICIGAGKARGKETARCHCKPTP